MKRLGRWSSVAVLAVMLAGCGDGGSQTPPQTVTPGGPGSFEADQKKQADMMQKAAKNPAALARPTK